MRLSVQCIGLSVALVVCCGGNQGFAQAPKLISQSGAWSSYLLDEKDYRTCWVAGRPTSSKMQRPENAPKDKKEAKSAPFKRQDVFFMVSHRPKDNIKNEMSYFLGADGGSTPVELVFNKTKKMTLSPKKEWAWFGKKDEEREWLKQAQTGKGFTLKTSYNKGPVYYDEYTFTGFEKVYDALESACTAPAKKEEKKAGKK